MSDVNSFEGVQCSFPEELRIPGPLPSPLCVGPNSAISAATVICKPDDFGYKENGDENNFSCEATEFPTKEFRAAIDGVVTIASTETTSHQKNGIGVNSKQVCEIFKFVMSLLDFVWSSSRTIIFNGIVGIICFQVTNDPKGGSRNVLLSEFWRYRQKIHFVFN